MRKIIISMLICGAALAADPPFWPTAGKVQMRADWTDGTPKTLYARWANPDKLDEWYCMRFDSKNLGMAPKEFTDIEAIALDIALHGGISALSDAEKTKCFANLPTFAQPVVQWKVAANGTAVDRPMYDGNKYQSCTVNPAITDKTLCNSSPYWIALKDQRAKIGIDCETSVIRPSTTKLSYHYTTNANAVRGLTLCEVK
jgi:hypothetical protein